LSALFAEIKRSVFLPNTHVVRSFGLENIAFDIMGMSSPHGAVVQRPTHSHGNKLTVRLAIRAGRLISRIANGGCGSRPCQNVKIRQTDLANPVGAWPNRLQSTAESSLLSWVKISILTCVSLESTI